MSGTTASPGSGKATQADRYLLGDSTAEVEHLVNQAEVFADVAAELLDQVGLAAGASAIDVGCGALGILPLLRDRVGPSGRVVGLDREARILDAARKAADQHGLPVEFVQGDATGRDLGHEAVVRARGGTWPSLFRGRCCSATPRGSARACRPRGTALPGSRRTRRC